MRGFTLLEVLVVIAIVGILTSAVTLSLRPDSHRQLQDESYRLARVLEQGVAAAEEGDPLALALRADGYAFRRRDRQGRWQAVSDDFFAARQWPDGIRASVVRAPGSPPWPLWLQGQSPWLVLRLQSDERQVDLTLSPLGRVTVGGTTP
ncbi:MAG: prepilin-type N-terminal cleavage/methylation domain-containing protein [Paludibacterium sp.]|uniref:prepilin-type N-terminal cleavage/methylation domain-containing protein n=1 Tax=Paludibacterium sp. TaxID=1917523 RepID=UPI0025FC971A|nr:prepilin-type N-terminal cleavage/methylation domain-containing protein [Paludibacterium sp.]MBV8048912.1 prepilin-type N-terminal cleavage/methylation domain-containing protein [Paludibacterium sp.]MBV8649716.1 prepilin-type N-terminal cleavage/methylation domain-containing protein [Paludibacterium sp.]